MEPRSHVHFCTAELLFLLTGTITMYREPDVRMSAQFAAIGDELICGNFSFVSRNIRKDPASATPIELTYHVLVATFALRLHGSYLICVFQMFGYFVTRRVS